MFTPIESALGAIMLSQSSTAMLGDHGRVLGISGIVDGALPSLPFGASPPVAKHPGKQKIRPESNDVQAALTNGQWRRAFLGGIMIAPLLLQLTGLSGVVPDQGLDAWNQIGMARLIGAGMLVGFGTRLGSGCTSGHMLCGISRLSPRSIVASMTFSIAAMITTYLAPSPFSLDTPLPIGIRWKDPYTYNELLPPWQHLPLLMLPIAIYVLSRQWLLKAVNPKSGKPSALLAMMPYCLHGLAFGAGLMISGMSNPKKVLGFLALPTPSHFDPSLLMVVFFGILPNAYHWFSLQEYRPLIRWETWNIPTRRDIDWKLVIGALSFGVGWGLAGVCPGPAIVGLGNAVLQTAVGGVSALLPIITFITAAVTMSNRIGEMSISPF